MPGNIELIPDGSIDDGLLDVAILQPDRAVRTRLSYLRGGSVQLEVDAPELSLRVRVPSA